MKRLLPRIALGLFFAQLLLMPVSWLLSAVYPSSGLRSLLSGEGLRWFMGHFTDLLSTPVLIWIVLCTMAWGCLWHSRLLHRPANYRESRALMIALLLLAVVVLLICGLILWRVLSAPAAQDAPAAVAPRPTPEVRIRERLVDKLIEVEKEVGAEEIASGLNDMGVLVTEEYYFTDVVHFSSIKKLFSLELGITASSFLASYDGVVTAGVDFTRIGIEKDDDASVITVTMPGAAVLNVDIDPDSFRLYEEKSGLGNPISAADFNSSLVELERSAEEKAIERGVLDHADENARVLIRNFVAALVEEGRYTVRFAAE